MQDIYEKLELFYLGRDLDRTTMKSTDALTLLKNKNFTTHAAIIGMTGSGKTGLGVGLIEEAALDNIPALIIDPKGDMGNLCLTDSTFSPERFLPWVEQEAKAKGIDGLAYANDVAKSWKDGIESFAMDSDRVARFASVAKTIYTPGSSSGVAINIMSSLEAPPAEIVNDSDLYGSYIKTTVSSLLALIGIEADPISSKEFILISQIISSAWMGKQNLSIEILIGQIINPPFESIGVLKLDDYYSPDDRFALATKFNALIASPHFSSWISGESLDIGKMLYDENGKAKVAIFTLSHLSDDERMFFVSLLLNRFIAWMRRQSGTEMLKAILYMDEIFGFFPPSKNPPSKEPMLLLLKQARAYGVGVVLSTQNPVDIDYKGLSNIGTWFIGRLQTTQDIDRVIEGMSGQIGSEFSKDEIRTTIANLPKRSFFIKSSHLDDIKLFGTRWTMSYLKGPMQRDDISTLMQSQKALINTTRVTQATPTKQPIINQLDDSIEQYFEPNQSGNYAPTLGAKVSIYYYNQTKGIETTKDMILSLRLDESDTHIDWSGCIEDGIDFSSFEKIAPANAQLCELPEFIAKDRGLRNSIDALANWVYQSKSLELFSCKSLKLESKVDEAKGDFMARIYDELRVRKDLQIEKLKIDLEGKEEALSLKLAKLNEKIDKEQSDSTSSLFSTGAAILGALFGKSSTSTKIGQVVSKGSKLFKERDDVSRVEESAGVLATEIKALDDELLIKSNEISSLFVIENYPIETVSVKPRKSDINILLCGVVWRRAG